MPSQSRNQRFTAKILPQLQEWFEFNTRSGCTPAQLKVTLVEAGYNPKAAERFLEKQRARLAIHDAQGDYDADPLSPGETALARFWKRTEVLNSFNNIALGNHVARIMVKNSALGIYFLTDFLTDMECESLIAQTQANLTQSTVVDDAGQGDILTPSRSSKGASLGRGSSPLIKTLESRVARLTNIPIGHGEGLQMLHYDQGKEYRPHFDYFDPASSGGAKIIAQGSQRLATVVMYLSDVECGGGTSFPGMSLEFAPRKGSALLFASIGQNGLLEASSLHAGLPVTSGEKWVATKWLRLLPFTSDAPPGTA
jgi:prolyl 4-hydroxylase